MDDLISRQAAIENYQYVCRRTSCKECPLHMKATDMGDTFTDCELELFLHNLPSVQPEPRWIPVEDKGRLPRDGQRVLVTDEDGEIDIAYFIDFTNIDESVEWWAHDYQCHPIAWSETPKPYERSEDE